jgi:hypothetical protein
MADTVGMERPADSALPQIRRSHEEWQGVVGALRDNLTLTEFFAVEASHVCANQTIIGQRVQEIRELAEQVLHGQRILLTKFEEMDGSVERLELFLADHFDYPLSQVYRKDLEELRARIRTVADENLREKLAAVLGEAGANAQLAALSGSPELVRKLTALTATVRESIAGIAREYQTMREEDEAARVAAEQERQRSVAIDAEAFRQAVDARAREIAALIPTPEQPSSAEGA